MQHISHHNETTLPAGVGEEAHPPPDFPASAGRVVAPRVFSRWFSAQRFPRFFGGRWRGEPCRRDGREEPEDEREPERASRRRARLTRRYGEGNTAVDALRGVSVDIAPAKATAVMGPSGSGKSTLMHILAGLDKPTSGTVGIAGTEITTLGDNDLTKLRREHIGFVFQFFNLLPMLDARENILLPLTIAGEKPDDGWFDQLVKDVGIEDRLTHRPRSSRAGSSSASRSRARSSRSRRCSSPTSRRATSTRPRAARSSSSCGARSTTTGRRS